MKLVITGTGFMKPSVKVLYWARQFEANAIGQIQIESREVESLENMDVPVLVIPENIDFKPIENILYATNFYSADTSVISQLAHVARTFSAAIHCVHIDTTEEYAEMTNVLADHFSSIAADLEVSFTNVSSDSVIRGIEAFVANNNIDLVAMLQHKHDTPRASRLDHIRLMVRESKLPLLLFPEKVFQD